MAATQPEGQATVIAVYPDHASAEEAVRRLHKEGIPMQNLSIIGKDFQLVVKPLGLVTTRDVAKGEAKVGAGRAVSSDCSLADCSLARRC
jgi:hypothetical protein